MVRPASTARNTPLPMALAAALAITALSTAASAADFRPEGATQGAVDCAALAGSVLDGGRVTAAVVVPAGGFAAPDADLARRAADLPAFCRVSATARPSLDSAVGIEIWMPLAGWNGRFLGTGNGGGAGAIPYQMGMIEGLKRGFAVATTDMGTAPDINLTVGKPERWRDFGYRATHEMTRHAKALVQTFYGRADFNSYFAGCSTGGQQALDAILRFPDDYDGVLAGDPGNNRTHVATAFLWNYNALNETPESRLTAANLAMVSRRVIAACAGKDGGAAGDRFLTDPRLCGFTEDDLPKCIDDIAGDDCLTQPQRRALRKLYAGPVNPRTNERIYAGLTPGSEDQPLGPVMQGDPAIWPAQQFYPFSWVFGPGFFRAGFDFDRDLDQLDARLAGTLNANGVDMAAFARRGGKLILYTGLADPAVPYEEVVHYYDRLSAAQGGSEAARQFARLFLVPGMGHCFGGPGATDFGQPFTSSASGEPDSDVLSALVAWTEGGAAPDRLIASHPEPTPETPVDRPICAYPALPAYRGGDPRRADAFACRVAAQGHVRAPAERYLN
ncbi:tannase/feruloyl esterase family alpha/beta hydrolase [Brevundimonas intermedia]|uniref:tannase/feruloyl esterase family alpha/beta hydrolase n=1 Tax=Brevundimonas intermedia TaxID=74315 RepID=UPI00320B9578